MTQVVTTRTADLRWDKRGIIWATIKEGAQLEQADAIENAEARIELSNNTLHGVILELTGLKSLSKEARDIWKTHKAADITLAYAIVSQTKISRIIGNLFMHFTQPNYPTMLFNNLEQSEEWILSQLEIINKKNKRI